MAYTPTAWVDVPDLSTLISAARLNKIEQGIVDAHESIGGVSTWAGDYPSLQAAIDATPAGGAVVLVDGTTTIATPLTITKPVSLVGRGQYNNRIQAVGCDAIQISAGVHGVAITGLQLLAGSRYTSTPNAYAGIRVNGTGAAKCSGHVYRDLYIDGFQTAIEAQYIWQTDIDNVHTAFGLYGIVSYGLSVNNTVRACKIVVGDGSASRLTGSKAIALYGQVSKADTTGQVSEGWMISNSLLYGGDYGLDTPGFANWQLVDSIVDFFHVSGVRSIHNGTAYGGNAWIAGCYIAASSAATGATACVDIANTVGAQRGVRVVGNDLLTYPGGVCSHGVRVAASAGSRAIVSGNTIANFTVADVLMSSSGNVCTGNQCSSTGVDNVQTPSGQYNIVSDNTGKVLLAGSSFPNTYSTVAGRKVARGTTAAPTALAWEVGDRVIRHPQVVGQPKAWVCTVAGTPGTWVSEGNL